MWGQKRTSIAPMTRGTVDFDADLPSRPFLLPMCSAPGTPSMTAPGLAQFNDEEQWIWQSFRHHSKTFSLATYLLPPSIQMSVATLYLFCRRIDSIADRRILNVGPDRAFEEVHALRERLDDTLNGRPPQDTILWPRLADIHDRHPLPTEPLYELIRGAEWDLNGRSIESKQDLMDYSNLVGGSVGALMLPFLTDSTTFSQLEPAARRLGIAMQITNIIRDVGEDWRRLDRVYLPAQWMQYYGVDTEAFGEGRIDGEYTALLERAMETAEALYAHSLRSVGALHVRVRVGIRSAARMYREIMNEVRANHYDNLNHRAYVSFRRKLSLILYDGYERRKKRLRTVD